MGKPVQIDTSLNSFKKNERARLFVRRKHQIMKSVCSLAAFLIIPVPSFPESALAVQREIGPESEAIQPAAQQQAEETIYESLRHYEFRDPEEDLKEAISKEDYRFMFVCGIACEAPGVDDYYDKYSQQYAYVTIDKTGDYMLSNEHGRLKAVVQAYAEEYNKLLIEEIERKEEG